MSCSVLAECEECTRRERPLEGSVHPALSEEDTSGHVTPQSKKRRVSPVVALLDSWTFHFLTPSVRDAAARLPNGEGTRAEICELLKDSQFLAPDVTSTQVGWRRDSFCFVPERNYGK